MQGLCIVAILDEFVGNLLRFDFRTAENNGENVRMEVDNTLQCQIFISGMHHIIDVIHVLGAFVA